MDERNKKIAESIEKSGYSYAELSELTGISKSTLQRYATGETKKIPIDNIERIAKATQTDPRYLMGWEETGDLPASKEFHQQIKKAMALKNITQSELCLKTGIPKSAMSQYISGAFKPKQERTYLIAKALNVNEAWLMGYDDVSMESSEKINLMEEAVNNEPPLTPHEKKVITAYRNRPEMQPAVDTLLGVEKDKSELIKVQVAARSNKNTKPHYEYITKAENDAEDALLQDPDEDM